MTLVTDLKRGKGLACCETGVRQALYAPGNLPPIACPRSEGAATMFTLGQLWTNDQGQDIAEYAVMLAVILVIVVSTLRLIGSNANNVFSQAASAVQ